MTTRKIKYENKIYFFNFTNFNDLFSQELYKKGIKVYQLEEEIANNIGLSKEAIHNWRFQKNGPSDINIIKKLAKELKVDNVTFLLIENKEREINMLDDLQKLSIKKIYDSIIDYLNYFEKTNGFNDLWFELTCPVENRERELYDIALKNVDKLHITLKKECFFLKNTQVYKDLETYEYNDIYDTFDGKLSYAFRFEADNIKTPSTNHDYCKALEKLNSIIDKYI